jgi:hypothetical protein
VSQKPVLHDHIPARPLDAPWEVAPRGRKQIAALWGSGPPPANAAGLFEWEGYWILLALIQEGRSLEVNYLEVRATKPSARAKPRPITKPQVLKRLPLADMVEQLEEIYSKRLLAMATSSATHEDEAPDLARLRSWIGSEAAKRITEQSEAPPRTGRGRPPKPASELQEVAKTYVAGGRKAVIESYPNYGKSTIDHWIRRCRDLGMIPEAGKTEED